MAAKVIDETHHWIAGNGRHWIAIGDCPHNGGVFLTEDWKRAYRCGSELGAWGLLARDESKRVIRTLVAPKKFRAWLLNEKVEVSPCRS